VPVSRAGVAVWQSSLNLPFLSENLLTVVRLPGGASQRGRVAPVIVSAHIFGRERRGCLTAGDVRSMSANNFTVKTPIISGRMAPADPDAPRRTVPGADRCQVSQAAGAPGICNIAGRRPGIRGAVAAGPGREAAAAVPDVAGSAARGGGRGIDHDRDLRAAERAGQARA